MNRIITIISFVTLSITSFAQELDWYANFHNIMDNREYRYSMGSPGSVMGARLDAAVGLKQDEEKALFVGFNYMYEYGGRIDSITPALNLYYQIENDDLNFYVGSFNREKLIEFPLFMFSDSLRYYRPNMSGMAFDFKLKNGQQMVFADWTGRKSIDTREAFIAGTAGEFANDKYYMENYFYMYHYAHTSQVGSDEQIQDNAAVALFLGRNMSDRTSLDILKYDIGFIGNMYRHRPAENQLNGGLMGRANLHHGRFGVDITSYWGKALKVSLGDDLYQNGNYTRIDLCAIPFVGNKLETIFKWSVHITDKHAASSQQFFLTARF